MLKQPVNKGDPSVGGGGYGAHLGRLSAPGRDAPSRRPAVLAYATRLCDASSEAAIPEEDYLLLRALTEKAVRDRQPTCKEVLEIARRTDPDAMGGVSARRVAEILKRYGLQTVRTGGKSVFRGVLGQLKTIETRYAVDLNTAGKDSIYVLRVGSY